MMQVSSNCIRLSKKYYCESVTVSVTVSYPISQLQHQKNNNN